MKLLNRLYSDRYSLINDGFLYYMLEFNSDVIFNEDELCKFLELKNHKEKTIEGAFLMLHNMNIIKSYLKILNQEHYCYMQEIENYLSTPTI